MATNDLLETDINLLREDVRALRDDIVSLAQDSATRVEESCAAGRQRAEEWIRDEPVTAVAAAAGAGFVLGLVLGWRSGD